MSRDRKNWEPLYSSSTLKNKFMFQFRSLTENNKAIKDDNNLLKITSQIYDLIKLVNKAFGIQIFCMIIVLLLFGIAMVYAFTSGSYIETAAYIRMILVLNYVHFAIIEISYYGHETFQEVCLILLLSEIVIDWTEFKLF